MYFEVANIIRQLALNAVLLVSNTASTYCYLSVLVILCYIYLIIHGKPYGKKSNNKSLFLFTLFLLLLMLSHIALLADEGEADPKF